MEQMMILINSNQNLTKYNEEEMQAGNNPYLKGTRRRGIGWLMRKLKLRAIKF